MSAIPPLQLIRPPLHPLGTPPAVDHIRNDDVVDTRWPELVGEHPRPFTMLDDRTLARAEAFQPATPDEVERTMLGELCARIKQQNQPLIPGPGDLLRQAQARWAHGTSAIGELRQQLAEQNLNFMELYLGGHVGEFALSALVGLGMSYVLSSDNWQQSLSQILSPEFQAGVFSISGSFLPKIVYYTAAYRAVKDAINSTSLSLWPTTLALGTSLCAVDLLTHDTLQAALTALGLTHEEISGIIKSLPGVTDITSIFPPALGGIVATASFGLGLIGSMALIKGAETIWTHLTNK